MGTHARIENGYVSIDTAAWPDQRTGGPLDDLTRDLRDWAARHHRHHPHPDQPDQPTRPGRRTLGVEDCAWDDGRVPPDGKLNGKLNGQLDGDWWRRAVLAWCTVRGHASPDPTDPLAGPMVIEHEGTRLDCEVWLALARTPDGGRIVVVQSNDDAPVVYGDAAGDSGDWFDADTVQIGCPGGHGWLWRTGRELLDIATGSFTTLTVVFGPNLDAPFTRCRDCAAIDDAIDDAPVAAVAAVTTGDAGDAVDAVHVIAAVDAVRAGRRRGSCGCDGTAWIVCPVCGRRCDVDLPPR